MFLLNNYSKNYPFKITKKNNRIKLEHKTETVSYLGQEQNNPVQYLCLKISEGERNLIKTAELKEAKFFNIETIYEKELESRDEGTYEKLISDFGDTKSKDRFKRREINSQVRSQAVHYNIENQFIPAHNRDGTSVTEIYRIDLMFTPQILENFLNIEIDFENLCYLVKKHKYTEDRKVLFIAIDCLYKYLNERDLRENTVPKEYKFFFQEIKTECIRGRMSSVMKDKLIVKLYILLLMVNNYKMHYDSFPKFGAVKIKIMNILRAIGCGVSSTGIVSLLNLPQETYSK